MAGLFDPHAIAPFGARDGLWEAVAVEHCRSPCGQPPFFAARHEKIENGMRRSCAWSEVTMPVVRACDADIPIYRIYTSFIYIRICICIIYIL